MIDDYSIRLTFFFIASGFGVTRGRGSYRFGAGASAIVEYSVESLDISFDGGVAGSLGEPDSHTKSGKQTGLLKRWSQKGESLGTKLQIKFP